jgi:Family of unknown function (DUF5701)
MATVEMKTLSFDDQLGALAERGIGVEPEERAALETARPAQPQQRSLLAWSRQTLAVATAAARIERRGKPVVLGQMAPEELAGYLPIEAVELPDAPAYLALDVDLGEASRNLRPEEALQRILAAGRSPLTLDEGVALVLQQPEAIAVNWGFSTAGSRRGDQRVPAFWISAGRPKLGWCWDRNPHTWLGTASCAGRLAAA